MKYKKRKLVIVQEARVGQEKLERKAIIDDTEDMLKLIEDLRDHETIVLIKNYKERIKMMRVENERRRG